MSSTFECVECGECPICMEELKIGKNCVTTECGHRFHTNCLMTSVAHNGFGCPYCRSVMAEEVEEVEEVEEDEEDIEDDDEYEEEQEDEEDALRGLRFFFNNINGDEHCEDDISAEEMMTDMNEFALVQQQAREEHPVPSAAFVTQKLVEQGVTMEQLVQSLLSAHEEYQHNVRVHRVDDELFGKTRIIISNYTPQPPQTTQDIVEE